MALITIAIAQGTNDAITSVSSPCEWVVTAPGMSALSIQEPNPDGMSQQATIEVDVWVDRIPAMTCSPTAQSWFSEFLDTPCQLVYMPESTQRLTDHGKLGPNEIVSFADAYPYLLISQASLDQLNDKLASKQASPVPMNRFRPNLVVSGDCMPHAEDTWKQIRIGSAVFQVAKPCARCSVPNVDQAIGRRSLEPTQTLATYRAWDNGIWFGQNLIQTRPSSMNPVTLQVGDTVEILATTR